MHLSLLPVLLLSGNVSLPTTSAQDDPAVAAWIEKLGTAESEAAVDALVQAGRPAVAPLIGVLETGVREQGWHAMRALRKLGGKADLGKARLVTVFRSTKLPTWSRGLAAAALGSMPSDAVTAVDPLVGALRENPVSELQICSAFALVEIGEASGGALGKVLTDKDREMCLWAANLLVELGPKATKAKLPLQRLAEYEKKEDQPLEFLLEPSIISSLNAIGVGYKEKKGLNDVIRDLRQVDAKKYGNLQFQYHGGVLPKEMLRHPEKVRAFLASNFGLGKDDPAFAIALPEKFEDWDRNDEFTVGELVQGLGNHVAPALRTLRKKLEDDSIRSFEQWEKESAELRGLLLAVRALTRPEFLTRSRCLEWTEQRYEAVYPRDQR